MTYLIIALVLLVLGFLLLWLMAVKGQTPKKTISHFKSDKRREDISFLSSGSNVRGWFIPSDHEKPQPLIIIVHGWHLVVKG